MGVIAFTSRLLCSRGEPARHTLDVEFGAGGGVGWCFKAGLRAMVKEESLFLTVILDNF
jgi:hypothetical protein